MTTNFVRDYHCKDEELTVICDFASISLKRDLGDFEDYSPKFNETYASGFDAKILMMNELVEAKSETVELKAITARLYATLDGLTNPINRLTGYINLAQPGINISCNDFGLAELRKGIINKDAESVIQSLRTINANIVKYNEQLSAQGFTRQLADRFTNAAVAIAFDNKRQYEIAKNRKAIVQNNLGLFNGLFAQLSEILDVGKILYKTEDPVKLQEYTFSELKKQVRRIAKLTVAANNALSTPKGQN